MESSCTRFTPAEGGARLAACAGSKNILVTEHTAFISTSVLIEHAYKIRGLLSSGRQRSVYVSRPSRIECVAHELTILTDLAVTQARMYEDVVDWRQELEVKEVLVCTSEVLKKILEEQIISIPNINVLVIDSCHLIFKDENLQYIMKLYKECEGSKPRVLALTYPLFTAPKDANDQIDENTEQNQENDTADQVNAKEEVANEINERDEVKDEINETIEIKDEINEREEVKDEIDEGIDLKDDGFDEQNDIGNNVTKPLKEMSDENKDVDSKDLIQKKDNETDLSNNQKEDKIEKYEDKEIEGKDLLLKIDKEIDLGDNQNDKDEVKEKDEIKVDEKVEKKEVNKSVDINNMDDFNLYEKLEWKIEELEKELCCCMDLAEDIDGGKRLSATLTKPKELIVEYSPKLSAETLSETYVDLENYMRSTVTSALDFINEHRYDPTEIYGEDLYEEFANIPNPTVEPKHILNNFLYVLDQLGPYAADKAAFSLLIKLEKLKIKVPYERHFLLLCLCTSVFVKIRCYADILFSKYTSDWEKITSLSTPKVLRLAEILEQFQPPENSKETDAKSKSDRSNIDTTKVSESVSKNVPQNINTADLKTIEDSKEKNDVININKNDTNQTNEMKRSKTDELLNAIEKCDFVTLGNKIEDKVNTYEANLKDLNEIDCTFEISSCVKRKESDSDGNKTDSKVEETVISKENIKNEDLKNHYDSPENSENTVNIHKKFNCNDIESEVSENDVNTSQEYSENNLNIDKQQENNDNSNENGEIKMNIDKKQNDNDNSVEVSENNVNIAKTHNDDDKISEINIDKKQNDNASEVTAKENSENITNTESDNGVIDRTKGESDSDLIVDRNKKENDSVTIVDRTKTDSARVNDSDKVGDNRVGLGKRHRVRGRGRVQRNNATKMLQLQQNPDALCGIVFVKDALIANIMFMMIVDMSRSRPSLSHLCAQYCASEGEGRDCQKEGKKQEEVLKKFRMHECNLLLATSVLEEGIDLPRCNLVVRWDVPPSYRSHGLCRGRARAPRASVALLASAEASREALVHNLAVYKELDQIITRKCGCGIQYEPPLQEETHADLAAHVVKPYTPNAILQNDRKHEKERILDKNRDKIDENHEKDKVTNAADDIEGKDINKMAANTIKDEFVNICDNFNYVNKELNEKYNISDSEGLDNLCNAIKVNTKNINIDEEVNCNIQSSINISDKPHVVDNSNVLANNENETMAANNNSLSNEKDNRVRIHKEDKVTKDFDAFVVVNNDITCNNDNALGNNHIIRDETDKYDKVIDETNEKEITLTKDVNVKECINEINDYEDVTKIENHEEIVDRDKINHEDETTKGNYELKVDTDEVNHDKNLSEEKLSLKDGILNEFESGIKIANNDVKEDNTNKLHVNNQKIDSIKDLSNKKLEFKEFRDVEKEANGKENVKYENIKFEYKVSDSKKPDEVASVDLNSAIALINRYCGKLPSDTFTRLTPQWWTEQVRLPDRHGEMTTAYICTLRMPLNCPVKYNIVGHPMPTRVLARRMVALQACRILHKSGELDNQLMPIGKENFKAAELETNVTCNEPTDSSDCGRPGTTKRRQYYFKRTAWAFTDCQAIIDTTDEEIEATPTIDDPVTLGESKDRQNTLYAIVSRLWCALPERYNTRGRRLHAPQNAPQAIGVLMARREPTQLQIPAFPVYTRSGEVRVSVEAAAHADVRLSPRRARLIRRFMRFVFSDVLRVRRRGMRLQTEGTTHNNYYIVPTVKKTRWDGASWIDVDWPFLELIYKHTEEKKMLEIEKPVLWEQDEKKREKEKDGAVKEMENPLLKSGETFTFDPERYKEAVVTPWYRNQDQPQFFLVAEICWKLSPDSAFPSTQHDSFRSYYRAKYGAELTQSCQPLLDVDHTSARLNLLTPRYVNRKGVALPVSSERTRRAKRDRLDQKQILVPELCRVHPFAAPLWFATVALPCVLYRINALLIADEIRRAVAIDVGLGIPRIDDHTCPGFQWPPLDFGWSLAEVLSADSEKIEKKKDEEESKQDEKDEERIEPPEEVEVEKEEAKEKTINDILQEKLDAENGFEIGTWSNDMASAIPQTEYDEYLEPLPSNLTFCTSSSGGANWSEPIEKPKGQFNPSRAYSMADSDCSYESSDFDTDDSDLTDCSDDDADNTLFCSNRNSNAAMGVRIEYKTTHEAEAVDIERRKPIAPAPQPDKSDDERDLAEFKRILRTGVPPREYVNNFRKSVAKHKEEIMKDNLVEKDKPIVNLLPEPSRDVDRQVFLITKDKLANQNHSSDIQIENAKYDKVNLTGCTENNVNAHSRTLVENSLHCDYRIKNTSKVNLNDVQSRLKDCNNKIAIENINNINQGACKETIDNDSLKCNKVSNSDTTTNNIQKMFNTDVEEKIKIDTIMKENIAKIDESHADNIQVANIENNAKTNIEEIFPYKNAIELDNGQVTLESIEKNKRYLLAELKKTLTNEEIKKLNCFSMKDIDIDAPGYINEKVANVGFDSSEKYHEKVNSWKDKNEYKHYYMDSKGQNGKDFDFDYQPDLEGHPGPSPSVILQALTMSNANDGINLERLETIGDSFLKFAITAYLYCAHPAVHEGKLSHMRSKQVSNLNLYRLGRNKRLGARMIASKFEPHDNWLPPCHKPPPTLQPSAAVSCTTEAPVDSAGCFIPYNLITQHSIPDKSIADCVEALIGAYLLECGPRGALLFMSWLGIRVLPQHLLPLPEDHPYVREEADRLHESRTVQRTAVSKPLEPVSDESCCSDDEDADPELSAPEPDWGWPGRPLGALRPYRDKDGRWMQPIFGELKAPPSPLLRYIEDPEGELEQMLSGYDALERTLQYRFRDRSLLLQALTHASHQRNRLTDCYQRLEFLGDAILDYLITRHLYEDPRRHSPGALTDLRSALVNNTIFATLAARHGFHKYFRHMSPGLNEVLTKYVKIQEENGHSISEEHYLIQEDEMEQAEDVEVPKALGDLFESVAGAIFLDSGMSLGAVWRSVGALLGAELDAFSAAAPKSPVRELLEAEPDTAKFGKPERLADGRRVRVCVEVFGRGAFKGIGRNYRIAKGTAARCALRHLRTCRPK
ncbi:endoribonuclease Dcr-1 [Bicyclus anynana]|uniref:Endoribonuclease Dcr-1 n=1 Tax=Bicyclus anynana TaxID=110368 RepID=A0ABM3M432_BICAN|nr:endoribonuclease Dcr-1 [Bicyclus anynana]